MKTIDESCPNASDAEEPKRTHPVRRIAIILFKLTLLSLGTITAAVLVYVLFFLNYSQTTPEDWQIKAQPAPGLEIPDSCSIEEVELNPYKKPAYEGYRIHRFLFTPDDEAIIEFYIDWFEPKKERPKSGYPLVMNSPITGGGMDLENIFSRYFADHGMAVCLVHRPKAYDREKMRLDRGSYWWRMMTRQSRIAYRWAIQREEIDSSRTASFGISNGGFRNTFFAAAEPGITAHIVCLAGADLVSMYCVSDFLVAARERAIQEHGFDEEGLREWLKTVIDLEPADYAPYTDPSSVLMICARFDRIVPYKNGLVLWEAFGRPAMVAVPFGHYSSAYAIPYIKWKSLQFMRQRFQTVSSSD